MSAYSRYYTHAPLTPAAEGRARAIRRLQRALVNGYSNVRFGTRRSPSIKIGYLAVRALPRLERSLNYRFRYLPRPKRGSARLLDVGCGNGAFLSLAASADWQASGCDFDPIAVEQARAMGLDIREGGPESFAADQESFDYITLSHVLEHVHDPISFLRTIFGLLKPGGRIYIDTPNIDSLGAERYGPAWRGLEPPRHLVLFNWRSLRDLLEDVGFGNVTGLPQPQVARSIWTKSQRMEQGYSPYDEKARLPAAFRTSVPEPGKIPDERTEFVTLTAEK